MTDKQREARVHARAQSFIDRQAFSGIQWRVDKGGDTWLEGRAGWSNALTQKPMADEPIYRIYSMTKPLISALALILLERGMLRLYDQVAAFLPDFARPEVIADDGSRRAAASPILIEHLLTHRAGLSYSFLPECPAGQLYAQANMFSAQHSLADMVALIAAQPLAFDPGSAWRYSVSTDVLARVIEVVSGETLAAILEREILRPLGLVDTAFSVPEAARGRLMDMFGIGDLEKIMEFDGQPQKLTPAQDVVVQYPADSDSFWRGGYGLFSTVSDYMKIAKFLASGKTATGERLLSRTAHKMMWTNRVPESQQPLRIGPAALPGYGFSLAGRVMLDTGRALSLTSVGERGWAGAASTYFWIDPAEDMIGVVMSQYLGSQIPLADDMRVAVYQALDD